jgi:hypothetical protein
LTTYPLSEPATIYAKREQDSKGNDILGQGTLAECADLIADFPVETRASARIQMDDLDLQFAPNEVNELLRFLQNEDPGLSNNDISAIPDPDTRYQFVGHVDALRSRCPGCTPASYRLLPNIDTWPAGAI